MCWITWRINIFLWLSITTTTWDGNKFEKYRLWWARRLLYLLLVVIWKSTTVYIHIKSVCLVVHCNNNSMIHYVDTTDNCKSYDNAVVIWFKLLRSLMLSGTGTLQNSFNTIEINVIELTIANWLLKTEPADCKVATRKNSLSSFQCQAGASEEHIWRNEWVNIT